MTKITKCITLDKETYKSTELLSKKACRNFSNYIETILRKEIKRQETNSENVSCSGQCTTNKCCNDEYILNITRENEKLEKKIDDIKKIIHAMIDDGYYDDKTGIFWIATGHDREFGDRAEILLSKLNSND